MDNPVSTASFEIREATVSDVTALAALHVQTFNETHGIDGPTYVTREYQWRKLFESGDKDWFCLIIENKQAELIGFAKGNPYKYDDLPFSGELNKIYLLRKYHKMGFGRRLICQVALQFLNRGISSMLLFGDANNPSNWFYEALGAERLYAENGEFHGGYGWRDLKILADRCSSISPEVKE